jgi:RNA polymerase sigma factor (sigma-70 family)
MVAAASAEASDEQLVAAARAGSDRAFETLFRRYRERIRAYIGSVIGDEARSEDVVQEVFISALRSLRATDRPIAFKPWIYQIARNACIDQIRRGRRSEEISIDADDFGPRYEGRLSNGAAETESAFSTRQDLENLRQAFGELPDSQHRILVMREFEGLSYDEIGSRMGLSAGAVESMLFRARRGLKGEFEDISTGERCRRMQTVIAEVAEGMGGLRERRRLVRHIRECHSCRRHATVMGIRGLALSTGAKSRRPLSRAAAILPIPFFMYRPGQAAAHVARASGLAGHTRRVANELGALGGPGSDTAASALQKAIAVIAAAAVVGGGGFIGQKSRHGTVPASAATATPSAASALPSGSAETPAARASKGAGLDGVAFSLAGSFDSTYDPFSSTVGGTIERDGSVTPAPGSPAGTPAPPILGVAAPLSSQPVDPGGTISVPTLPTKPPKVPKTDDRVPGLLPAITAPATPSVPSGLRPPESGQVPPQSNGTPAPGATSPDAHPKPQKPTKDKTTVDEDLDTLTSTP